MQEVHSFEYATIRVMPRVEREEFLNVGVILYCPSMQFLKTMIRLDIQKLSAISHETDTEEVRTHLAALEQIANGTAANSPIAKLDIASRFRWLTATRSTIVQCSKVHPGLCTDPVAMVDKLFNELVL